MKPLILTGWSMPDFTKTDFADLALDLSSFASSGDRCRHRTNSRAYLGPRTPDQRREAHTGRTGVGRWKQSENRKHRDLSLAEFCQHYETVELWFDMRPNAQLQLVWLLDYFRSYPETVARLKLRVVDLEMIGLEQSFGKWRPPVCRCHREGT